MLGITPNTYVWMWRTEADQSFTIEGGDGEPPIPATLPPLSHLGAMGLLGWRRKRKVQVSVRPECGAVHSAAVQIMSPEMNAG
jgi:hypothetical protein